MLETCHALLVVISPFLASFLLSIMRLREISLCHSTHSPSLLHHHRIQQMSLSALHLVLSFSQPHLKALLLSVFTSSSAEANLDSQCMPRMFKYSWERGSGWLSTHLRRALLFLEFQFIYFLLYKFSDVLKYGCNSFFFFFVIVISKLMSLKIEAVKSIFF